MSAPHNICQCGAFAGYPHEQDCPYPLFTDAPAAVDEWTEARKNFRLALEDAEGESLDNLLAASEILTRALEDERGS